MNILPTPQGEAGWKKCPFGVYKELEEGQRVWRPLSKGRWNEMRSERTARYRRATHATGKRMALVVKYTAQVNSGHCLNGMYVTRQTLYRCQRYNPNQVM